MAALCPHATGSKWPAQVSPTSPNYGTALQHFFVKILFLNEITGSEFSSIPSFSSHLPFLFCLHSFLNSHPQSFNYIFCVKEYKSGSLHSIVLKHWCQNLNFLLNPSHLMCLWLAKLNTAEVKFNLLPSNHVFLFLFLLSFHLCPSYPIVCNVLKLSPLWIPITTILIICKKLKLSFLLFSSFMSH